MRGSPCFPQNALNIVYGQLDHGLVSNPRRRRLCFRDMDTPGGRGKHKLSRDDGHLSGIKPLATEVRPSDNSTCVLYLKCQGRTKVSWLTYFIWKLFHLCIDHNIQLVAVHLAGKLNSLVDQLSRATRPVATEWALNSLVFRAITQKWGEPGIDLFATRLNKQLLVYVSPCPDD